jgi:hypothetical protein
VAVGVGNGVGVDVGVSVGVGVGVLLAIVPLSEIRSLSVLHAAKEKAKMQTSNNITFHFIFFILCFPSFIILIKGIRPILRKKSSIPYYLSYSMLLPWL